MEFVYVIKAVLKYGEIRLMPVKYIDEEHGDAYCYNANADVIKYYPGEWYKTREEAANAVEKCEMNG